MAFVCLLYLDGGVTNGKVSVLSHVEGSSATCEAGDSGSVSARSCGGRAAGAVEAEEAAGQAGCGGANMAQETATGAATSLG